MIGPTSRGKVGLGFSQFRENWCPSCHETFQTEQKQPRPETCRLCGSPMPPKGASPLSLLPVTHKNGRPIKSVDP